MPHAIRSTADRASSPPACRAAWSRAANCRSTTTRAATASTPCFATERRRDIARFLDEHDAARDGVWLLVDGGRVLGSIVIDCRGADARTALVHRRRSAARPGLGPPADGTRDGRTAATRHARVVLHTFSALTDARRLYEAFGFTQVGTRSRPFTGYGRPSSTRASSGGAARANLEQSAPDAPPIPPMSLFGLPFDSLALFALAVLLLALTPGPVWIYLISRTLTQGRRAGYFSLIGVMAGVLVHLFAAAARAVGAAARRAGGLRRDQAGRGGVPALAGLEHPARRRLQLHAAARSSRCRIACCFGSP